MVSEPGSCIDWLQTAILQGVPDCPRQSGDRNPDRGCRCLRFMFRT